MIYFNWLNYFHKESLGSPQVGMKAKVKHGSNVNYLGNIQAIRNVNRGIVNPLKH